MYNIDNKIENKTSPLINKTSPIDNKSNKFIGVDGRIEPSYIEKQANKINNQKEYYTNLINNNKNTPNKKENRSPTPTKKDKELEVKKIIEKRNEIQSSINRRITSFNPDKFMESKNKTNQDISQSGGLSSLLSKNFNQSNTNQKIESNTKANEKNEIGVIRIDNNENNNKNVISVINSVNDKSVKVEKEVKKQDIIERKEIGLNKKIIGIQELSQKGYSGPEIEKINQDISFVYPNFGGNSDHVFFGVW